MRNSRAGVPSRRTISAAAMNGNAGVGHVDAGRHDAPPALRAARGPAMAHCDHCSVTETHATSSSGHSTWAQNSMWAITPTALAVVVDTT